MRARTQHSFQYQYFLSKMNAHKMHIYQAQYSARCYTVVKHAVHGRLQTRPQSIRNWSKQLGKCCVWSWLLQTVSEMNPESRRETSTKSSPRNQLYVSFLQLLMRLVQQGLPLAHWSVQPHRTLQHNYELTMAKKLCLSPANEIKLMLTSSLFCCLTSGFCISW